MWMKRHHTVSSQSGSSIWHRFSFISASSSHILWVFLQTKFCLYLFSLMMMLAQAIKKRKRPWAFVSPQWALEFEWFPFFKLWIKVWIASWWRSKERLKIVLNAIIDSCRRKKNTQNHNIKIISKHYNGT